jgi:hypothetical protein
LKIYDYDSVMILIASTSAFSQHADAINIIFMERLWNWKLDYTHTNRQIDTHINTDRQTDRQTHKHTDRHTDRHTDTLTDRHTDRQTDTHTHSLTSHTHTHAHGSLIFHW